MKLLTKPILNKLVKNLNSQNAAPVVKFFTPDASATWLLSEYNPETEEFFGLCDLGFGEPELGYVSLSQIQSIRGKLGLPVERDTLFEGKHPISVYAKVSRREGRIVERITEDQITEAHS